MVLVKLDPNCYVGRFKANRVLAELIGFPEKVPRRRFWEVLVPWAQISKVLEKNPPTIQVPPTGFRKVPVPKAPKIEVPVPSTKK